jgi:hypothetical protein
MTDYSTMTSVSTNTSPEISGASRLSRDIAADFLLEQLKDGQQVTAKIIQEQAKVRNISMRTLMRAKRALSVRSKKRPDGWVWELRPQMAHSAKSAKDDVAALEGRADPGQHQSIPCLPALTRADEGCEQPLSEVGQGEIRASVPPVAGGSAPAALQVDGRRLDDRRVDESPVDDERVDYLEEAAAPLLLPDALHVVQDLVADAHRDLTPRQMRQAMEDLNRLRRTWLVQAWHTGWTPKRMAALVIALRGGEVLKLDDTSAWFRDLQGSRWRVPRRPP